MYLRILLLLFFSQMLLANSLEEEIKQKLEPISEWSLDHAEAVLCQYYSIKENTVHKQGELCQLQFDIRKYGAFHLFGENEKIIIIGVKDWDGSHPQGAFFTVIEFIIQDDKWTLNNIHKDAFDAGEWGSSEGVFIDVRSITNEHFAILVQDHFMGQGHIIYALKILSEMNAKLTKLWGGRVGYNNLGSIPKIEKDWNSTFNLRPGKKVSNFDNIEINLRGSVDKTRIHEKVELYFDGNKYKMDRNSEYIKEYKPTSAK